VSKPSVCLLGRRIGPFRALQQRVAPNTGPSR
jgi:hypothetical protein